MRHPKLTFGTSVTDPANFQLAEIRDRPSNVTNKFRTAQLRTEWDVAEGFQIKAGAMYRASASIRPPSARRSGVRQWRQGRGAPHDHLLGILGVRPDRVYGFPATGLSEASRWAMPVSRAATPTPGWSPTSTRRRPIPACTSAPRGGRGQHPQRRRDGEGWLSPIRCQGRYLRPGISPFNAGMRFVRTDQAARGLNSGTTVTVDRSYDDWLPSMNVALFPMKDFIIRGAVAKVITRPTLGNLTPGGTVDGFNYRITFGNPFLDPFRATAYDLAFEWYFAPQSIASVALFKKDIESFPVSVPRSGTFASTGLPLSSFRPARRPRSPEGQLWTITGNVNGQRRQPEGRRAVAAGAVQASCRASCQFRRDRERDLRRLLGQLHGRRVRPS
jgi:iron complex outermembrane receptor protein